jgi:hypothetical protein
VGQPLKVLTVAENGLEANMICGALESAGIEASTLGRDVTGRGAPRRGGTKIYVREQDLEQARETLAAASNVDEAELAALSEACEPPPD